MFTMDVPYVPAQEAPIVLAQAATSGDGTQQPDYLLTLCKQTESTGDPRSAFRAVDPAGMLSIYLQKRDHRAIDLATRATIKPILLEGTTHGKIVTFSNISNYGGTAFRYDPIPNYTGNDRAVFLAEFEGKVYKIVVNLVVSPTVGESPLLPGEEPVCPPPKLIKVNGKPVSGSLGIDLNNISVSITDLPDAAIGQTTGNAITLDTNAANYNWFIDSTPADNSEYLPTSNPYEWVAKAGSAAEGKMDMLSVLLHEYGHALGIDHSADGHDYMATTLTPGVRRMPSAEELALMQQLVAQAKGDTPLPNPLPQGERGSGDSPMPLPIPLGAGFGIAFLGRLRNSRYGGMSIDTVGAQFIAPAPQYEAAANATFTNLNPVLSPVEGTPAGWNTQGGVDIAPSSGSGGTASATLSEVSTSQTRLSQVFTLNARDRYLSFKLSGLPLPNPLPQAGEGANVAQSASQTPQDAFEVALLDANTGASLLGNDGLMEQLAIRLGGQKTPAKSLVMTRTDAIINLQGDGTQRTANCVTCINNADSSRTYRVDLTGIAAGTVANLSFDLLGFGAANSHVTLSDIRVSGLPQLHDDAATLAEDNLLSFDPFAQADVQLRPLLASHVVDAPTHGAVAVNADGTFSYTPDLNYFGGDSFSYRLSDPSTGSGQALDSNLATVSLTVTPVLAMIKLADKSP